jgi:hypothetical protein
MTTNAPDHAGHHGAGDDVDPFVPKLGRVQALVDGIRLDESEAPGREGRPDRCRHDDQRLAAARERRHRETAADGAPIGVGEEA